MSDEPQVAVPQEIKDARTEVRKAIIAFDHSAEITKQKKQRLQEARDYLDQTIDDLSGPSLFNQDQDNEPSK